MSLNGKEDILVSHPLKRRHVYVTSGRARDTDGPSAISSPEVQPPDRDVVSDSVTGSFPTSLLPPPPPPPHASFTNIVIIVASNDDDNNNNKNIVFNDNCNIVDNHNGHSCSGRPTINTTTTRSSSSPSTTTSSSASSTTTTITFENIFSCFVRQTSLCFFLFLLFASLSQASAAGMFEVQLVSFKNDRGFLHNGTCCSGDKVVNQTCPGHCNVTFFICLSHFQLHIPADLKCTFGNVTVVYAREVEFKETIHPFPFKFVWPGDFVLAISAFNVPHGFSSQSPKPREGLENGLLIHESIVQDEIYSGATWTEGSTTDEFSELRFRYRIVCLTNHYGRGCNATCIPRDDDLGHYKCNKDDGSTVCFKGWSGQYCDKPVCDCHHEHGKCRVPNKCECSLGWTGPRCDQCISYPGCQMGTCIKSFDCICHPGWGGLLCNQDLNFCFNSKPCKNGGTCTLSNLGGYKCTCPPGYNGTNCEIELRDCRNQHQSCRHGGSCVPFDNERVCRCTPDREGLRCEVKVGSTCKDNPCQNNSTCVTINGDHAKKFYRCICQPGYIGNTCELNINECSSSPCRNDGKCVDEVNSFSCVCPQNYHGTQCEKWTSNCSVKLCHNEGTCQEDSNGVPTCQCRPGFSGQFCQNDADECLLFPCTHGGTCVDRVNGFICLCTPGFKGHTCEIKVDLCAGKPCLNGATCSPGVDSFQCHCPYGYQGLHCEILTISALDPTITQRSHEDETTDKESNAAQMAVAVVAGILLPVLLGAAIIGVLLFIRRRRRLEKVRDREKNDLAVISTEEVDNSVNKGLNLNNRKNIEKSSQKMAPEEVNLFNKYGEDEPPDLPLNFQRNPLNLHKHQPRHQPKTANDSNYYRSKVPTKYKEINHDAGALRGDIGRHTEV